MPVAKGIDSYVAVITFVEDIVDTEIRSQRPVTLGKLMADAKIGYSVTGHRDSIRGIGKELAGINRLQCCRCSFPGLIVKSDVSKVPG